jgi:hypothetical protein
MQHPYSLRKQRGQSAAEFLVFGSTILVTLFFGVMYLAKYADVKHATNQASRYAAFERALDPGRRVKSDDVIAQELRVRYFTHLQPIDNVTRTNDARAIQVPLWTQADGSPLLLDPADVSLSIQAAGHLERGVLGSVSGFWESRFRQTNHGIHRATVSAGLSEIGHFAADDPRRLALTIRSATAIGAGSYTSSGSTQGPNNTCPSVAGSVPHDRYLGSIGSALEFLLNTLQLESSELRWGIVKPDLVPEGSLVRNGDLQNWQNVAVAAQGSASPTVCP